MLQRGRKSAEARAASIAAVQNMRPEPPDFLDTVEAKVWREIVERMPPEWFPRETHSLLAQYCRHEAALKFVTRVMHDIQRAEKPNLVEWRKMARERRLESKTIMLLAMRMRLTQQSSYNKGTAYVAKRRALEKA